MRRFATLVFAWVLAGMAAPSSTVFAQAGGGHQVEHFEGLLSADSEHAGSTAYVAMNVRLKKGYHVNSNKPLEGFLIPTKLSFDLPEGVTLKGLAYPEALLLKTGGSEEPLAVFEEEFHIGVALDIAADAAGGEYGITANLHYQACNDKACFRPQDLKASMTLNVVPSSQAVTPQNEELFRAFAFEDTGASANETGGEETDAEAPAAEDVVPVESEKDVMALLDDFTVMGAYGGYMKPAAFIEFVNDAETGVQRKGWFEGKGPLAILALILAGGLALNLTPCVLPMIPINLAIIGAGAQAGSRARGFALGGAYGLAMAAVYGVLGLIVILTASSFGTINSYWWFNLGIAVLFVFLALAMFDIIAIDFSKLQSKIKFGQKSKGTFLLAFGMGAVAALLAGACVAPVVIQVIVFASDLYAQDIQIALALPFFLGLGMALPWPFAGGGLSLMPKPGPWMVRVKQAFGVFILAFAGYYGWQTFVIASANWVDDEAVAGSVQEMLEEGWYASITEGLEVAKAENKPVLVDMWATWCKNCLTMDKTTFKDEMVLTRLDDYVKIKFQAQDPEASPARELLERFDGIGLPTYAILSPGKDS